MSHWTISRTFTLGILTIGAALLVARPVPAIATDTIDPATQPHLKSWSNVIPAAKRFVVLADFNNEAVLDRETGLVWERSPNVSPTRNWSDSRQICVDKNVGGRRGWRLPSIHELTSLLDDSRVNPALLSGHPFTISNGGYWSATLDPTVVNGGLFTSVWAVDFGVPGVRPIGNDSSGHIWCVRGPMNADTY